MPSTGSLAVDETYHAEPAHNQIAVLSAPKEFTTRVEPVPDCAPHQVVVRLQGCGVCASSLPVWEGRPWFDYPMNAGSPGHEAWGIITEAGSEVRHLEVGQRVTCLGDRGYARYMAVDATDAVVLPPQLDNLPFPGEAIGCAMNIFRRADIEQGQNVAIIGAGFLGLLLTQLAANAGANVYMLSRRQSARDAACRYGAQHAFDTEDWWGNAHKVVELTNGRGCERVIEVTGLQFALDTATEMIAEYGKLIIAGFHQDGLRQVNMQTWNWRAIDVINAHERNPMRYVQGIREAVEATVNGTIKPQQLLTHEFTMDELDTAFQMMVERPDGFIKGWVRL